MSIASDSNFEKANSPKEILDLVDENDQIIGTVNRTEANSDPNLIHREVAVLLFDEKMRLVIQKRSEYKTVNPGMWSLVAGHIPAGGDPHETAYTELAEELGLDGVPLKFLDKRLIKYPHETHFMYFFIGKYSGEEMNFDSAEVSAVKVVSEEEVFGMNKGTEVFNDKYYPILSDIYSGKIEVSL